MEKIQSKSKEEIEHVASMMYAISEKKDEYTKEKIKRSLYAANKIQQINEIYFKDCEVKVFPDEKVVIYTIVDKNDKPQAQYALEFKSQTKSVEEPQFVDIFNKSEN